MAPPYDRMRAFRGESLRTVAFPLGGIGTGTVSLGGRGNLRDWEVFNRPAKGRNLPYTFFSIWAKRGSEPAVARILERQLLPPFEAVFGLPTAHVSGLPRLSEATFRGGYPLAQIDFEDCQLPLEVTLEAFNPFVPMNDLDSSIPCAILRWRVTNPSNDHVSASIAFSLLNACGCDGQSVPGNRHHSSFGLNLNEFVQDGGLSGIRMSTSKYQADHAQFGTMAAVTLSPDVTWSTRWERAGWWDDVQDFWDDFSDDGLLSDAPAPEPSPDGQTDVGTIAARVNVDPGRTAEAVFILAWHFPNLANHWNSEPTVSGLPLGNWYATQWPDAWSAARYAAENLPRLEAETRTFCEAFFDSSLPDEVLDAVSANASIMRTTTCMRTSDGRFHGFEGCGDNCGCCPMNCTHVWNYEQTLAHLFPSLERTVRQTDFLHNTRMNGDMAFRTLLPLQGDLWAYKPCADGQMGTVMKVYREWLQSGDRAFLEELWPAVQRALEFAWSKGGWDADKDGVMEGEQHNTYDIEFYGPNTMMGTFYLGALRAAEEMALALGKDDKAALYRSVFESGRARMAETLWNGEYFFQDVRPASPQITDWKQELRYQYGDGCLSDHMLGQWFARVVGLGNLLPVDKVRDSVRAIHTHNFRRDLSSHHSVQRVYALNNEAGLVLCSWPRGGRPKYPFPYADEVWTGIEYQVAAHLIYEGFVEEGLDIVRAVRNRHDGARRNPWNEFECGHHYARAMSSWSVLLALSGCLYDAPRQTIRFAPAAATEPFRCFFSAGTAWGTYSQEGGKATLSVRWGTVTLKQIVAAGRTRDFADPIALRAGDSVTI